MGFALSDMRLSSAAFTNGSRIPDRHTTNANDTSPPLAWTGAPDGTRAFAVICHDPDAPLVSPGGTYGFVHWVLYNLDSSLDSLEEASTKGTPGRNDFGNIGYGGPQPPGGHGTHHYFFWIIALDSELNLPEGLTLWEFLEKGEPHIIGMNRLVGTYSNS